MYTAVFVLVVSEVTRVLANEITVVENILLSGAVVLPLIPVNDSAVVANIKVLLVTIFVDNIV